MAKHESKAAPAEPAQDVFEVRRIRRLAELMREFDLAELDLQQGETRIVVRRGATPAALPVATALPAAPAAPAPAPAAAAPADDTKYVVIKSPMVGTFYAAPDPESPAYVKVGDHIGPETTVCIIEAMKVFNQIPAEVSGKIVAALVENGQSVDFGQPLFKVDPRG